MESYSHLISNPFTYLGSNISSIESYANIHIGEAWTAIDRLSTIWESNLCHKIEWEAFQAVVMSVLLYSCTTLTLMKCLEKKLDGNHSKMLCTVLNKYWIHQPTKHLLYGHLPSTSPTILVKWMENQRQTHKWSSSVGSRTWTHSYWSTSKDLHSSAQFGHWMPPRGLFKCNGWLEWITRES